MILKNVSKIYNNNKIAIDNISLTLPNKGLIFILGKSGSGKSTLLNLIGGIDRVSNGSIIVDDYKIEELNDASLASYRNSYCGFVFQEYNLIESLNVYDNVKLAIDLKGLKEEFVSTYLNKVGLFNFEKKKIGECSGGEKQRIAIARALIKEPNIILCDEVTAALDSKNSYNLMALLKDLAKERLVIVVSHNENLANLFADGIIKLKDGKVIENNLIDAKNFNEHVKLKESKLNNRTKFKLASLNIKTFPIRTIFNIILLSLSFLLLIFFTFINMLDFNKIHLNTINKSNYNYVTINKKHNGYDINLNESDVYYLDNIFNNSIGVVNKELSLNNVNYNDDLLYYSILPRGYTFNSDVFNNFNVLGRLPNNDNEIAISKFLNEIITYNGLIDKEIDTMLNDVLIVDNKSYQVVGIIDTNFTDKFNYLKKNNDEELLIEYINYLNSDISSLIVFNKNNINNIIDITNNPILINENSNRLLNNIILIDETYDYKIINDEEGIIIPIYTYLEILSDLNFDLSIFNGSDYYETFINNISLFKDTFKNLYLNTLAKDYKYKVVGVYDNNSNNVLMTKELFDIIYQDISGIYDNVLVDKSNLNLNKIKDLDNSYLLEENILNNINNFKTNINNFRIPLVIITIILLIMAVGIFIININTTLTDKTNIIAILKMLGCSNKNIFGIIVINILPFILLTFLTSTILSFFLFNYFANLIYIIYSINLTINVLSYLFIVFILIIISIITIYITFKKINKLNLIEMFHFE